MDKATRRMRIEEAHKAAAQRNGVLWETVGRRLAWLAVFGSVPAILVSLAWRREETAVSWLGSHLLLIVGTTVSVLVLTWLLFRLRDPYRQRWF